MDDDSKLAGVDDAPARTALDDRLDAASASVDEGEKPEVFNVARTGGRRAFLQNLTKGAAVGATVVTGVGGNCNAQKTPTGPTGGTQTTTTTSTTSTTSTTTTSIPAAVSVTLAGVVSDRSGRPVGGARVFVVDGPNQNKASNTDGNGYYSIAGIIPGSFTLRTTLNGVFLNDAGLTVTAGADRRFDFSVTTTSTTTTSTPTTSTATTSTCGVDAPHYWYPN